ncbi:MAG TPA: hypothetical protein PLM33_04530 [Acidobacteriota bacterium]|nr:hypothetical protein [Acidobacteriota bacterium]HRV08918.1 hypothetical protein [Acidobacteriota bacterium]
MNCERVQELLAERTDARELPEVESHLLRCSTCREVLRELEEIEELSRSLAGRVRAPRGFARHVAHVCTRRFVWQWKTLVPVLSALVFAVGMTWVWQDGAADAATEFAAGDPSLSAEEAVHPFSGLSERQPEYVEVILSGEDGGPFIVRVPSVIEVRRTSVSEDYYIDYVSH